MLAQARMLNVTYKTWAKLKRNAVVFVLTVTRNMVPRRLIVMSNLATLRVGESYDIVCTYDDLYPF